MPAGLQQPAGCSAALKCADKLVVDLYEKVTVYLSSLDVPPECQARLVERGRSIAFLGVFQRNPGAVPTQSVLS